MTHSSIDTRTHNFNAGPAVLPLSVLQKAQSELCNFNGSGMSVMELSHRSKPFESVLATAESNLRTLMGIPSHYHVLFLQGGASLQFSMVPMNLVHNTHPVDLIHTGVWSKKAMTEIKRVTDVRVVASGEDRQFTALPDVSHAPFNPDAPFVHITSNNTIYGTQWPQFPATSAPLVADMSSDILSRPIDVSQFGVIYAGAQKNIGPSGVTLVIIREDLVARCPITVPTMLQYRTHVDNQSLYNTPPTFGIYMVGLVCEWLLSLGGLPAINRITAARAQRVYDAIDASPVFFCPNEASSRSAMNVVFRSKTGDESVESAFLADATRRGMVGLKGHRSAGGLRASLYNAQTDEAVSALVQLIQEFRS